MTSRFTFGDWPTRAEWSPARISEMCELYGSGKSMGTVGAIMGLTRNALIGKFNRLSLDAGRAGLDKAETARRLSEGESIGHIANIWGVSAGSVEARLAEIRRALGPQAI